MASELKRFGVISNVSPEPGRADRPTSMIGWADHRDERAEVPDDLTWSDVAAPSPAAAIDDAIEPFLHAADAPSLHEAMRALSDACVSRWRCDAVVWSIADASPDSERVVFVRSADGRDEVAAAAELAPVPTSDLDRAVRHCLSAEDVITADLPTGERLRCAVWLAWRRGGDSPHALEASLLRAAGVSLRAAWLSERLEDLSPRSTLDLVRRDRREAAIGKLLCAAAPAMVAAHASLATAHASLRSELAGFRVVAPLHPSTRACASLLDDAWDASQLVWESVSAVASLADETSRTADAAGVIRAVAALVGPYVEGRARVVATTGALPLVRLAPAYLAEALVMFVTRVAYQFADGGGARVEVRMSAAVSPRGVEIDVCASAPSAPKVTHHEQDAVVGEVYGRDIAMRCGGSVEVLRDALGATTFKVLLPRA